MRTDLQRAHRLQVTPSLVALLVLWVAGLTHAGLAGGNTVDTAAPVREVDRGAVDRSPATPRVVYTFDARPLRQLDCRQTTNAVRVWDTWHVLAAVQGLANRRHPQLYVLYCDDFGVDTDAFWLDWLRGEDGWLRDVDVRPLGDLEAVVRRFESLGRGWVIYDPAVPATACVASTAAGCEDLVPLRYDPAPGSVYQQLRARFDWPVGRWLIQPDGTSLFTGRGTVPETDLPTSGSAKGDAYRWAVNRYLTGARCAPGEAAYYLDAAWVSRATQARSDLHTLSNHDFFIARRGFFFDLSCWGDEVACDDPGQSLGLDRRILVEVLRGLAVRAGDGMVRVGGFTPWPFKYTDHPGAGGRHGGVETEWEFSRIVSQFNGYVEADAAAHSASANASFVQHYPLAARYPQKAGRPGARAWRERGYVGSDGLVADRFFVGHYVGDYDAPSWLYKAVPAFFRDPARGSVPLGWAFNPNLADRAAPAMVYARRHATTNDWFIAGDSGAGYLNPRGLTDRPDSGLASGLGRWAAHCRPYYERWDLSITGFVLDGAAGASTETELAAYRGFSPDGLGTHFEQGPRLLAGVATCPERDLPDDAAAAADRILEQASGRRGRAGFLWARSILKPPRWYAEVAARVRALEGGDRVVFVDPYTFFGLIRWQEERGGSR